MSGRKRLAGFVLGAAITAGGITSMPAHAVPTADALARINAQRHTHGLPAFLSESPSDTDGCRKHIEYMKAQGGGLVHDEEPDRAGYTPEGDDAGNTAVLAIGGDWSGPNPWETAPIHLAQTLAPRLSVTGIADYDNYTCMTTIGSDNRTRPGPSKVTTYTYPGNGTSGHRTEEMASEEPYTPGELVGIPEPTLTGAYIYVFFDGPNPTWSVFDLAKIHSASLTGPDGPVEIKILDNYTTDPNDSRRTLNGYTPTGGMLIPVKPLQPNTSYTAKVTATVNHSVAGGSTNVAHEWSFASGTANSSVPPAKPPDTPPPSDGPPPPSSDPLPSGSLKLEAPRVKGRQVLFTVRPSSALAGRQAQIVISKLGRRCGRCKLVRIGSTQRRTLALTGRRQTITVARPRPGRAVRVQIDVANLSWQSMYEQRRRR